MSINIFVCAKQVMDPETPSSAFNVDPATKQVTPVQGIPPVVNGFCENAVEAALQIKETAGGGTVTILSVGNEFVMDVMKKPLSMGADNMVLIQDQLCDDLDALGTVNVLAAAIKRAGDFDLILCGQQASDWDNAHVPLGLSETLSIPCLTEAKNIEIGDNSVTVNSSKTDGYEVFEANLPALITVNNEIGQPRYPNLRGIMAASKKQPTVWSLQDLGLDDNALKPKVQISEIFVPVTETECEYIDGDDDEEKGRNLALKLREAKII